jgi:hypothetical protein
VSALILIVAITVVEQLPNASISSWSWLLAGTLLGRVEGALAMMRDTRRSRQVRTGRAIRLDDASSDI